MSSRTKSRWVHSWPVDFAIRLLYYSGTLHLIGLLRKWLGRRRLVILMYHRLSGESGETDPERIECPDPVPIRLFEEHMRLLRWFGSPMALDDAYQCLRQSSPGPRSLISVTFDDGYRDNFLLGFPVWTKYRVPVSIFPAVAPVDQADLLWWDKLLAIVGEHGASEHSLGLLLNTVQEMTRSWPTPRSAQPSSSQVDVFHMLCELLTSVPMELRDTFLGELSQRMTEATASDHALPKSAATVSSKQPRLYMNWEELKLQARQGVRIGGHTMRHPWLPLEDMAVAEREIGGCRTVLQEMLGTPVTSFAYPGGYHGEREVELVKRAGYRIAVTVEKGANFRDTHPYRLRRIGVSWDRPYHLALKLALCGWLFHSRSP